MEGAVTGVFRHCRLFVLSCSVAVILLPRLALAQQNSVTSKTNPRIASAEREGQHDFDWDIVTWKTHQRRLLYPLTGSTTWVEYNGTDVVRKIWDGANSGVVEADGPSGYLEIFTLRTETRVKDEPHTAQRIPGNN